jgi:DNA-binding CsgD family transcriptional regulator
MDSTVLTREMEMLEQGGPGIEELAARARALLGARVAFDDFGFCAFDPLSGMPIRVVRHERVPSEMVPRWMAIEVSDARHFNISDVPLRVGESTSVLSAETGGELERSARYREIFRQLDLRHELRLVFRAGDRPLGGLSLSRDASAPDFDPEEVKLVAPIVGPLAEAMWKALLGSPKGSLAVDDWPAVLVLSVDDRVVSCSELGERVLAELADVGPPDPEKLPIVIRAVALRARRPQEPGRPASAGARTRSGQWLTIRGTVLDGGRSVALVIEPTRTNEASSLIFTSYGLSAREREVADGVLRGRSNEDVGEELGITAYTVQDHLKSIFDKTGFSSRKELAARLFWATRQPPPH